MGLSFRAWVIAGLPVANKSEQNNQEGLIKSTPENSSL
jgi:hypothetical protein